MASVSNQTKKEDVDVLAVASREVFESAPGQDGGHCFLLSVFLFIPDMQSFMPCSHFICARYLRAYTSPVTGHRGGGIIQICYL